MTGPRPVPRTPPSVAPAAVAEAHSPVLGDCRRRLDDGQLTATAFWATVGTASPIVEPDPEDPATRLVSFLWRDPHAAHVVLEVNKVTSGIHQGAMDRIPGTDIWHRTLRLDARWRGGYGFVPLDEAALAALGSGTPAAPGVDGRPGAGRSTGPGAAARALRGRMVPDPRNPLTETGPGGAHTSVAELDLAPAQPWLARPGRPAPVPSPCTGPGGRALWEWTAPTVTPTSTSAAAVTATDYPAAAGDDPGGPSSPRPLVVVLDGEMWRGRGHVSAAVESLSTSGRIRPPVVVWVDNGTGPDRTADLSIDSDTARWLARDLIPWLRDRHSISRDPRDVVVVGQSLGGLTALKTTLDHPDAVGAALAQSSSLWQDDMLERAGAADPARNRLWLEVGTHEPVLLEPHRRLRDVLLDRGVPLDYREYVGGHDPVCWRGGIGDGLLDLLSPGQHMS